MIRLFRILTPRSIWALLVSEIILVAACYSIACAGLIDESMQIFLLYDDGITRLGIVVTSVILGLYYNDCYAEVRVRSRLMLIQQVCLVVGVTFLVQGLIAYAFAQYRMPRRAMIAGSILCLIFIPLWRILYASMLVRL